MAAMRKTEVEFMMYPLSLIIPKRLTVMPANASWWFGADMPQAAERIFTVLLHTDAVTVYLVPSS